MRLALGGPDDPRAALRWSLTQLRPLLDEADATRLVTDRERIAFAAHGAVVDVAVLPRFFHWRIERVNRRTQEPRPGYLPVSSPMASTCRPAFGFTSGARRSGKRWATLRQTILSALIERLRDLPEEALIYARNRAALDALDETGHIAVIQLLTTLVGSAKALRHYDYCRQVLEAQLGSGRALNSSRQARKPGGRDRHTRGRYRERRPRRYPRGPWIRN